MSVRKSVQTLVLSALQASDASSSEAAQALNSLLEAERSLLPEIASQLRRSNKITEEIFQLLISAQQQEENIIVDNNNNNNDNNNNNNDLTHRECERIEVENRGILTKFFQDKISELENQNGDLHSQLVVAQAKPAVTMEQHALLLAELEQTKQQAQQLVDVCNSCCEEKKESSSRSNNADDEDEFDSIRNNNNIASSSSASSTTNGWTKEVWFAAFQQLEQNSKKMLSAEESEKLRVSLSEWKDRASNAINRVSRLETDVNSLRFTNGVLQEQLTSLLVFAEKAFLAASSSTKKNNNNNNDESGSSLLSIPNEIQNIIMNNNNNNNNLKTSNLLSNHAVNAAFRTVELVEDFSSVTVHRNNDSSSSTLGTNQIPLGAFTFNTVKQLVERFTELSQALYVQELEDVEGKKQMLDRQKRYKSEKEVDDGQDEEDEDQVISERRKVTTTTSTTTKVMDTRSIQTDESHLNNNKNNNNKKGGRNSEDAANNNNDSEEDNDNEDDDDFDAGDDLSLQIDADPQIFNAIRQIALNLESGFASASHSESELNNARLAASKSEIESLNKQLQSSRAILKQWQQRCGEAEERQRVAQTFADELQRQLKVQEALAVQVPMIKEMPGILTRFEGVLSTIARNLDIEKDENAAKVIASDNMKRHVGALENLFGRLQAQYDAFSELTSVKQQQQQQQNINGNSNNNNNNSNVQKLQQRIKELEDELQSQSQDLENERTRTIEQLERMYQAEEQSRQLRNEMRDLRASALSAEQAQVLRDEIDRLENTNNQILNGANQVENELRREIKQLCDARDNLQRQVQEAESRTKTFQAEADRHRQDVLRANAALNDAHGQISQLSRSFNEATASNNKMAAEIAEFQIQVDALKTALLSEAAVRDHFARLFPADSAGREALARVAHLDQELHAHIAANKEFAEKQRELTNQLGAVRNQLQESESDRVTSRMRAATAEAALKKLQDRADSDAAASANEVSFLRQDCQRLTAERDAALERSKTLVQHVDTLSHDQLSASARLYGLTETRSFNLQMQEMNDRNKSLQSKLDDAHAVIAERENEMARVQSTLKDERDKISRLETQISDYKDLETMLREAIATGEASLTSTTVKLNSTADSLKQVTESRNELSNEIATLEVKLKGLQSQNGELSEAKKRLETTVEDLKKDVADRDQLVAVAREAVAAGGGGSISSSNNVVSSSKKPVASNNNNNFGGGGVLGRFTSAIFGSSS